MKRVARFGSRVLLGAAAAVLPPASGVAADERMPLRWSPPVEIAAGPGVRGPWRQNESRYDYVDDPSVALDEAGAVSVAWVDQARKDVFFQSFAPDGSARLARPVNVSRTPATFSWLPRLALEPDAPERVYALWQEIIFSGGSHGGDILFARSEDGGASFAAPINLSRSVGGDGKGRVDREVWSNGSLDILAAPGGLVVAAWTEYHGPLWASRSTDGGRSFSAPRQIAGSDAEPARGPSLARARDGAILLAWTTGEDARADILTARSRDGGATFDAPRVAARTKGYSDAPTLAVDSGGTVHLVFAESAGGPFAASRIVHARSADGGLGFTTPKPISPPGAAYPSLGIDAKNALYVLWESFPSVRGRPRGLGMTLSRDGGGSFAPPVAVPGSADPRGGGNGSHQGLLARKLAVSGAGEIAVVNSSLEEGERSRVWLMRAAPAR